MIGFLIVLAIVTQCSGYSHNIIGEIPPCDKDNQFTCADGFCISKYWVCDNENDCSDGEDEQWCDNKLKTCPDDKLLCNGQCVLKSLFRCNGFVQCSDGIDEAGCSAQIQPQPEPAVPVSVPVQYDYRYEPPTCRDGLFYCNDRCVVNSIIRCNGLIECRGATDELGCENTCSNGQLSCGINGGCYDVWQKCDGIPHCFNGLDETDCAVPVPSEPFVSGCSSGQVTCFTGECIDTSKFCDGQNDCLNGEDEFACAFVRSNIEDYQCIKRCYGIPEDKKVCAVSATEATTLAPTLSPLQERKFSCDHDKELILFGDKCVSIHVLPPLTWKDAKASCEDKGRRLLELPEANCFIQIIGLLNNSDTGHSSFSYYVGANDIHREGEWIWDGSKTPVIRGTPMWLLKLSQVESDRGVGESWKGSYDFIQQPSGGTNENCGILSNCPFMYLNDVQCHEQNPYVCEEPARSFLEEVSDTGKIKRLLTESPFYSHRLWD